MKIGVQSENRGIYINPIENFMFIKRDGTRDGLLSNLHYIDFYSKVTEKENLDSGYILSVAYDGREFRDNVFMTIVNDINSFVLHNNSADYISIDLDAIELKTKDTIKKKPKGQIQIGSNG